MLDLPASESQRASFFHRALVLIPALNEAECVAQTVAFCWNIEMQVRVLELGVRWVELPVAYHPRLAGQSKISGSVRGTIQAAWGMTRMILRLWLRKGRRHL